MVPEKLTEELLELEQECEDEEESREKETAEERSPKKIHNEGVISPFADINQLLKKFVNIDPNIERFSLIERNAHGALLVYKQICDKKNKPSLGWRAHNKVYRYCNIK